MNWERSIRRVLKGGEFTEREEKAAGSWNTCAIDEAHGKSPRVVALHMYPGEPCVERDPTDPELHRLGTRFADYVRVGSRGDGWEAARTYAAIQARVAELAVLKKFKLEPVLEDD